MTNKKNKNEESSSPKILTIDIETAPLESYTWGLWDQNVGLEQIKTEWSILSYAAKWLNSPRVIYKDTSGRGRSKVRDDKGLLQGIHDLLDEADIVVGQNVRHFDIKKINARMVILEIPPYSPIRIIDTMEAAKKNFEFTSNKLAWMSKYLTPDTQKEKHKKFPGFELWSECLKDNPEAWNEMRKYNRQDIIATEKLYLKLRPWIKTHPNVGIYNGDGVPICPKCGSTNINTRGTIETNNTSYQKYHCVSCGGWSRGKVMLTLPYKRKSNLVSV